MIEVGKNEFRKFQVTIGAGRFSMQLKRSFGVGNLVVKLESSIVVGKIIV